MRRRNGFTIIEILAVIALLGAFLVLSTALFRSLMGWMGAGSRVMVEQRELDDATSRLREDVWTSYEVAVGDDRTLVLRQSGDRSVAWQVTTDAESGDRILQRTAWRSPGGVAEALPGARSREVSRKSWPIPRGTVSMKPLVGGVTFVRTVGHAGDNASAHLRTTHMYSQIIINRGGL